MKAVVHFLLIGVCGILVACASRMPAASASSASQCADVLRTTAAAQPVPIAVGPDCVLEVRSTTGATVSRAPLVSADKSRGQVRRIVATPELVFVLRDRPTSLDVYEVPTLAPISVIGSLGLREPTDLAILRTGPAEVTAYVLDNVRDSRTWSDADLVFQGPRVLRVALERHKSARRDVLVARSIDSLRTNLVGGLDQYPSLDAIDVLDNELRVVVVEGQRRYAEYFTLDGVLLEREPLGGSR